MLYPLPLFHQCEFTVSLSLSFPQLPESSIGKALRLLHERLSSKVASGVHVESSEVATDSMESEDIVAGRVLQHGLHSSGVGVGCNGLSHSSVEGILINGRV